MKRTIAILLALLSALSTVGCGSTETETEIDAAAAAKTETETEAVETVYPPEIPEIKFEGSNFNVLYQRNGGYWMDDIYAEGITGEIINDAVYNRNSRLEEKYDITLTAVEQEDAAGFAKPAIQAADGAFDMVGASMNILFSHAMEGLYLDWNTLSYVDPFDPWWDSNSAKDLSVGNKLFLMAGNISYSTSKESRLLYISKGIMQEFNLELPYDLVRDGKWTLDRMTELVKAVSVDRDGDGVYTADDTLGLLKESTDFFMTGCGVLLTEKDESDMPFVNCINERTISAIEKITEMMNDPNSTCSYESAWTGKDMSGYAHGYEFVRYEYYANNHFLFVQNGPAVSYQFAEMDPGFGILPNPKLDEAQESYYHLIDSNACILAIPVDVRNIEMVDILLDDWAYMSDEVIDAYYETTLKGKRFNAPDDSEMLDIVRATTRYEISNLASFGISEMLHEAFSTGNLMSVYTSRSKVIDVKINRLYKDIVESDS